MDMLRVTARWVGFPGAPGYSNFFFSSDAGFWDGGIIGDNAESAASDAIERTSIAFNNLSSILPEGTEITINREVDIVDSDTGETLGSVEGTGRQPTDGSATGGYAGPSGAVVNWRTADYRFGRRIRGRTFLVPLAGSAYQDDGTLTSSALSDLRSFASQMVSGTGSPDFGVWSRPRSGTGGVFASVVSSSVPDLAAVLRSRRD